MTAKDDKDEQFSSVCKHARKRFTFVQLIVNEELASVDHPSGCERAVRVGLPLGVDLDVNVRRASLGVATKNSVA